MKKLSAFCLLLFGINGIKSQNLNVAHHSYVDEISNLVSIGTRHFYTEEILNDSFGDSSNFVGINNNGQILFKKHFGFNEANRVYQTIKTLDNCILVVGLSNGCDVNSSPQNFLIKIDTTGIIKFQVLQPSNGFSGSLGQGVQHTDSSYYFIEDSALVHFSKNGQFISKITTGIAYPTSIALTNSGDLLVNGPTANFLAGENTLISTSATVLNQQNANNYTEIHKQTPAGNFYGLTWNGTIEKISSALLATTSTSATLNQPVRINTFVFKNDSIFYAGNTVPNQIPVYGIMDANLNSLYMTQAAYKNIFPSGITVNNQNRVNIIANATSTIAANSYTPVSDFISFYQFPSTGSFMSTPDIGVQSYSVISSIFNVSLYVFSVNLSVTIKNYGNDTIKNFYLNSSLEQDICGFFHYHRFFSTTIPPNSSATITTSDFRPTIYPASTTPGTTFSLNLCLYTTVPNQHSDSDISNDKACGTLMVTVTGIDELSLKDQRAVKVSPNPFTGELNIESSVEIKKVVLLNLTGAVVKEEPVSGKTFSFDNSGLAKGIYLLKVETEKGVITKKVVKN